MCKLVVYSDWSEGEAKNRDQICGQLEKELMEIISIFSEDRKKK
jgi:hypothetical protein